jgi:hypothetical protein
MGVHSLTFWCYRASRCNTQGEYLDVWSGETKAYSDTITFAAVAPHETVLIRLSPAKTEGVGGEEL